MNEAEHRISSACAVAPAGPGSGIASRLFHGLLYIVFVGLMACTASSQDMASRLDQQEVEVYEEIEALKRAVEASYDRERAMADRLRQEEESNAQLRQQMEMLQTEVAAMKGQFEDMDIEDSSVGEVPAFRTDRFNVHKTYQAALATYRNRRYDEALGQFAETLSMAPYSEWADNAQYWIGECYYGLGKFQQALIEFTKVFAYQKTEKDDHAQLKIARCYLSLGEKDKALMAFQKLLDEYPESDKIEEARQEMRYLQGP